MVVMRGSPSRLLVRDINYGGERELAAHPDCAADRLLRGGTERLEPRTERAI